MSLITLFAKFATWTVVLSTVHAHTWKGKYYLLDVDTVLYGAVISAFFPFWHIIPTIFLAIDIATASQQGRTGEPINLFKPT